jgi:hypothetical protein
MGNMLFTREELENIWQNKPYGYFRDQLKKIKGKQKFKIKLTAYKTEKTELGSIETTVYAKDRSDAIFTNRTTLESKLKVKLDLPQWDSNVNIDWQTEVVR